MQLLTIECFEGPREAIAWCRELAAQGLSLGFVPTMGALHEGHQNLVRQAALENDRVCVSIFVNPLQFGESLDLESYPRDFTGDAKLLNEAGCHMAFTGTLPEFFPGRLDERGGLLPEYLLDPGPCAEGLEGEYRVGHFEGVATIVGRFFEILKPKRAYFGQKDYQQALVVRDLARNMDGPEVVICTTHREPSGMAFSSRNTRLSESEYAAGMFISRALFGARALWNQGQRDPAVLARHMQAVLKQGDLFVEYAAVRDPEEWNGSEPVGELQHAVALIAARAGDVRLIDNMLLSSTTPAGA
ncbi:MAG: pantoate--beta-alanine ligase [Planctomycetes bacterium]|nr:pantoate--beta-alanine ligase [Planctomycetota bacterium]